MKNGPKFIPITVHPPDYDKTFTYSLKRAGLTIFDDGNRLEEEQRHALTSMVEKLNSELTSARLAAGAPVWMDEALNSGDGTYKP